MQRPHIDWPRTIAGALAAVAAAVLLSKLGAAGTLIGAAIGSIVISIGTNVGAHGIETTRDRMFEAQAEAARRVAEAQNEVRKARVEVAESASADQQRLSEIDDALASAKADLERDVPTTKIPKVVDPPSPERALPWRRILVFAASLFVLAMLLITAFELIGGRPLSSYTGGDDSVGTTISDSVSGPSHHTTKVTPSPLPSVKPTPSTTPSATPTSSVVPTSSATPSANPSATPSATPTENATPTPSATVTPTTTPTPTESATP